MKLLRKICLTLLFALAAAALVLVVTVNLTPNFTAWALGISPLFNGDVTVPEDIAAVASQVNVAEDIYYTSRYSGNTLDVYAPVGTDAPLPTLFFIHGGAFIAGDKEIVKPYALALAPNGYTIVAVNYALAPGETYPAPLAQIKEAYAYIRAHPEAFPTVDLHNLAFGGDSAGAQLAAQFVALQTNPALAAEMAMTAIVPADDIKAAVLYCGPYDLAAFRDVNSFILSFFVRQLGWAYFGEKDWLETTVADQASVYDYVTAAFPPAFITDGNFGSFEDQGKALQEKLFSLGVPTDALFFPTGDGKLLHEYQFSYDAYGDEARECFTRTLDFLNHYMKE